MERFMEGIRYKLYQKKLKRLGLREVFIYEGSNKVASIGLE
jgi:hypothetical protein